MYSVVLYLLWRKKERYKLISAKIFLTGEAAQRISGICCLEVFLSFHYSEPGSVPKARDTMTSKVMHPCLHGAYVVLKF